MNIWLSRHHWEVEGWNVWGNSKSDTSTYVPGSQMSHLRKGREMTSLLPPCKILTLNPGELVRKEQDGAEKMEFLEVFYQNIFRV